MQPIIISQGTQVERDNSAEKLVSEIFGESPTLADFKLLELPEGKKFIPIELIRELIKDINIKPRISDRKVIWIKESQSLSVEAQNALLKTLEEPPKYAQIILTVDHASNLIPTVLSRCIIRSLNLSNRVDVSTERFAEIKEEFLNLIKQGIGEKVDWVTENKEKLKSREDVIEMLNKWEVILRGEMVKSAEKGSEDADNFKNRIRLLQKIKSYIQANANASLAIETLLLNI